MFIGVMFSFRIPRAQWHAEINIGGHTISINILPLRGNGANDLCKKKFTILLSEVALHNSAEENKANFRRCRSRSHQPLNAYTF